MSLGVRRLLFVLFFLSGFCGLVYQVVWTRMAFAAFGIITPVLSVVLSVFMLGLAVGSWLAGTYAKRSVERTGLSPALLYAAVELLIGVGAVAVPKLFAAGERLLLAAGETDSIAYLSLSALVLGTSILPWCICMGATYPLMMAYVQEQDPRSEDSFSYLYLANVLGAMAGTLLTAVVLVEMLGFRHTLYLAAAFNLVIASASASLGWRRREAATVVPSQREPDSSAHTVVVNEVPGASLAKWILFSTGLIAMAMEVVWSRAFTQVLQTQVYSFASVVFMYLGATFVGSLLYRRDLRRGRVRSLPGLIAFLAIVAFIPVLVDDPRLVNPSQWTGMANVINRIAVLLSICPLCAGLGYLTPHLIDAYGAGNPARAGRLYALNVLGCIVGPLVASYGLLPWISERQALIVLGLPFLVLLVASGQALEARWRFTTGALATAAAVWALVFSLDFATVAKRAIPETEIRRDHAASVIATGRGDDRQLLVNGIGMTMLTPITKFMAHLPLAFQKTPPRSALIICFGMGTSYRSALSWNLETTAVELVPSVRDAFGYYHADSAAVLRNPKGRIVIDDGRRFLARTRAKYDVIVIDPPPPVEAAGSSLLYSNEFYEVAKQHLNPGGILQAWIPEVQEETARAITLTVTDSFPYVRRFASVARWGTHLLASMEPIEPLTAEQLEARMPETAKRDLIEWSPSVRVSEYLGKVLAEEKSIAPRGTSHIAITDDRPYNEYFLLRTWTSLSE